MLLASCALYWKFKMLVICMGLQACNVGFLGCHENLFVHMFLIECLVQSSIQTFIQCKINDLFKILRGH